MTRRQTVLAGILIAAGVTVVVAGQWTELGGPFEGVELTIVPVAGNVHMVQRPGGGGNIGVFAGSEGVLLVDSLFAPLAE